MAEEREKADKVNDKGRRDDAEPGILPDGVRGTTRDTGHTIPKDEHEGYEDPTRPAFGEKNPRL